MRPDSLFDTAEDRAVKAETLNKNAERSDRDVPTLEKSARTTLRR